MSKADDALKFHENYNCAQSVVAAYAADYGLDLEKALSMAVGFGGGMGRTQETCGAVTGAIMVLGLSSRFKEEDRRPKINEVYAKVNRFIKEFAIEKGTAKCRDLLGCDLTTEEGQKFFKENKLRENCLGYVRFCCDMLDEYLAEKV